MTRKIYQYITNIILQYQSKKVLDNLFKRYSQNIALKSLSKEQIKEVQDYWFDLTGTKVSVRWHQLLYSLTGNYSKEWMPFEICMKIQDRLSPRKAQWFFDDKNLYRYLLKDFKISQRHIECTAGSWLIINGNNSAQADKCECSKILSNLGPCVIKPSRESDGGNGVRLLNMKNGIDEKTGDSVDEIIAEYYPNFLVEDKITEWANLSNLNPDSCNTMRVHTWRNRNKNRIEFISAYMRIGKKGTIKDNMYSGGMGAEVFSDGTLSKGVSCYPYRIHDKSDFGTYLNGYRIEDFNRIKDTALRAHANLPMFDLCGWDIAIDDKGDVIIIEFNPNPDVRIEQAIFGTSCYKEHTEEVCKQVFKE
jgi:hypothetical protein